MSAVVACGMGQSNTIALGRARAAALMLLSMFCSCAFALDDNEALVVAQSGITPAERMRPQLEISSSTLPRFDNIDGASRTSRIDMRWLPPRRSALGLSLGMGTVDSGMVPALGPRAGSPNTVDLGLHWRYMMDGNLRVDVTAWRRVLPPDALTLIQTHEPSYGARVEMRITRSPPRNGLVAERGFVGLQLESGARVTLKRSGGKPMIYYRSKF